MTAVDQSTDLPFESIEAVRAEQGTVVGVLALVDREEGGRQAIEAAGVPVISMVKASQIIRALGG